jgi:hypothetical protein
MVKRRFALLFALRFYFVGHFSRGAGAGVCFLFVVHYLGFAGLQQAGGA